MSGLLVGLRPGLHDEQDLTAQRDVLTVLGIAPERIYGQGAMRLLQSLDEHAAGAPRFDHLTGREPACRQKELIAVIMFVVFGVVCLFVLAGVVTVNDGIRGRL